MERRKFILATVAGTGGLLLSSPLLFPGCSGNTKIPAGNNGQDTDTRTPTDEGQRYLFPDDHWIERQSGVSRSFHAAVRDRNNPVPISQNCSKKKGIGPYVFHWGSKQPSYSAWFGTYEEETGNYPTSFITSDNRFNWTGVCHETDAITVGEGNKQCAVHLHNGSALYGDYPYLCATGFRNAPDCNRFHWRFRRSRDGVHWEIFPGDPVWGGGPSDVMHIQWDGRKKKFVAYFKVWRYKGVTLDGKPFVAYGDMDMKIEGNVCRLFGTTYLPTQTIDVKLEYGGDTTDDGGGGTSDTKMQMARVIGYAESSDFLHWENEQIILEPPSNAPLGDQSYGMPVTCYGNMYMGMYCHFNSLTGLIQPMVAWSYDGIHFTVHDRQFFINSGKAGEWDYGMILPSEFMDAGNGQLYIFYGSLAVDHLGGGENQHGALGRAWLRRDGFASLKGGWIETVPLKVQSKQMSVNMTGEIGVSLKSVSGEIIGETTLSGDHHNLIPDIDLSAWKNKDVTVHLDLSKGELFSVAL